MGSPLLSFVTSTHLGSKLLIFVEYHHLACLNIVACLNSTLNFLTWNKSIGDTEIGLLSLISIFPSLLCLTNLKINSKIPFVHKSLTIPS